MMVPKHFPNITKLCFLLLLVGFSANSLFAQCCDNLISPVWAFNPGGDATSPDCLTVDAEGSVYLVTRYAVAASVGDVFFETEEVNDSYLAKYDKDGEVQFAIKITSGNGMGLQTTPDGNLYLSGFFRDSLKLGTEVRTSTYPENTFVAKLNTDGEVMWLRVLQNTTEEFNFYKKGLSIGPNGEALLAGQFRDTLFTDSRNFASAGGTDIFMVEFDSDGVNTLSKTYGGPLQEFATRAVYDAAGNIYLGGNFITTAIIDDVTLTGTGSTDIFLVKFNAADTRIVWTTTAVGPLTDRLTDLTYDEVSNRLLLTGTYEDNFEFAGNRYTNNGDNTGLTFLASYALNNELDWLQTGSATNTATGYDVTVNSNGELFFSGQFGGELTFGARTTTSAGVSDGMVALLSPLGQVLCLENIGFSESGRITRAIIQEDSIYLAGFFNQGTVEVAGETFNSANGNIFVGKYLINPPVQDSFLGPDLTLCAGEVAIINPRISDNSSLLWSDDSTADSLLITESGTYGAVATLEDCGLQDTLVVTFEACNCETGIDSTFLGEDITACDREPVVLSVNLPDNFELTWPDGSTGRTLSVAASGTYIVNASLANCSLVDTIVVTLEDCGCDPPVDEFFLPADTTICQGLEYEIGTTLPERFSLTWSNNAATDRIVVNETGTYSVTATAADCEVESEVTITFEECPCEPQMPNAFTPNNDEVNDVFMPVSETCIYEEYSLKIYARWGNLIFETDNSDEGWEGEIDNEPAPMDTYVYVFTYRALGESSATTVQGEVTLIR